MRLSEKDKDARIVELYKAGWSFRQLQKRYHRSPNYIAMLVKGIEVTCAACGKTKGKVRFHAHHPDRLNRPDYTIPLCPSCHAKEEAKLRREKKLLTVAFESNSANGIEYRKQTKDCCSFIPAQTTLTNTEESFDRFSYSFSHRSFVPGIL